MWGPLVISWFISPNNYSYKYHKTIVTIVIGVINQLSYLGGPTLYFSMVFPCVFFISSSGPQKKTPRLGLPCGQLLWRLAAVASQTGEELGLLLPRNLRL